LPDEAPPPSEAADDSPPRPRRRIGLLIALSAVLVVGGAAAAAGAFRAPAPRTEVAAFELPSVSGEGTVALTDRGDRPAVVNFFASWCAPCRRELPHFAAAERRADGRVAFLGVAHLDDADLAAEMLEEFDIDYPAGNDPEGDVARAYALRGMPSTVFVTGDGRLLGIATGELSAEALDGWIERLLDA
jgi:cytochrome c biogenesis protein CcmG, thiol:disulfide interchange protein DsbE